MLAYYTTTPTTCQVFFEKIFDDFNLAPHNLAFSPIFGGFWANCKLANSFFQPIPCSNFMAKATVKRNDEIFPGKTFEKVFPSPLSKLLTHGDKAILSSHRYIPSIAPAVRYTFSVGKGGRRQDPARAAEKVV